MPGRTPSSPPLVIVLVVIAALAACLIAAASFAPADIEPLAAWPAVAIGLVALVASLLALWVIQRRRDRTLR
jgi:membrane protein YdbS with pleckstrin-like domain